MDTKIELDGINYNVFSILSAYNRGLNTDAIYKILELCVKNSYYHILVYMLERETLKKVVFEDKDILIGFMNKCAYPCVNALIQAGYHVKEEDIEFAKRYRPQYLILMNQ
jgi:hypothetical protein